MKLFNTEESLFQKRINEIITDEPGKQIIEDIIKLYLLKIGSKDDSQLYLSELYNLVGVEQFANIIDLMDGRTVKFPESDSFKEIVEVAICYYYKYLKNKDWKNIEEAFQDEDMSHIKLGIKITQLDQFIKEIQSRASIPKNEAEVSHE
jgi:hypothetical protein